MEISSVRSTRTVRGWPSWITSSPARITSASPQPPPTVPIVPAVGVDDHLGADFPRDGAFDVCDGGDGDGEALVEEGLEVVVEGHVC